MEDPTLHTITLCEADWRRVIDALRHEAYQITLESQRACEKGAHDYGTLLWEETAIYNSIADDIDFALPERDGGYPPCAVRYCPFTADAARAIIKP